MAKVLLIDDDADTRLLLRCILEKEGHQVLEAPGGNEGLRIALAEWPHCVVMDVGLPDRDGYDVARAIRTADPGRQIALAALTGYSDEDARARGRHAGFDAYMVKPVEPKSMAATVGLLTMERR